MGQKASQGAGIGGGYAGSLFPSILTVIACLTAQILTK